MPKYNYSKILTKDIIDIVNECINPHPSEYLFKFDECLDELEETIKIVNAYNYYLYIHSGVYTILNVIKDRKYRRQHLLLNKLKIVEHYP